MNYKEFYNRFAKSYRRKNIYRQRPKYIFKYLVGRFNKHNKRHWTLPKTSELPDYYIRLDPWEGEYLFYLASMAKKGIVETGRYFGGSTFLMACANSKLPIHSIDIEPQNDETLKAYFAEFGVGHNADLIIGDSQKTKYEQIKEFDLLWIDGDHSYEGCTNDLESWFGDLLSGGHVVLHDCYTGSAVKESVIDFINKHKSEVEVIVQPYKNSDYWHYPEGSLTHFIKK